MTFGRCSGRRLVASRAVSTRAGAWNNFGQSQLRQRPIAGQTARWRRASKQIVSLEPQECLLCGLGERLTRGAWPGPASARVCDRVSLGAPPSNSLLFVHSGRPAGGSGGAQSRRLIAFDTFAWPAGRAHLSCRANSQQLKHSSGGRQIPAVWARAAAAARTAPPIFSRGRRRARRLLWATGEGGAARPQPVRRRLRLAQLLAD